MKVYRISYNYRSGENKNPHDEVVYGDAPIEALTEMFANRACIEDAADLNFTVSDEGVVSFSTEHNSVFDENSVWSPNGEDLYEHFRISDPLTEAQILASEISEDKLATLIQMLMDGEHANDVALSNFNALFIGDNTNPDYDEDDAEMEGVVKGQNEAIGFVLGFLRDKSDVLPDDARAFLIAQAR